MLEDLSIYENTRRNEPCPCGSGKIFKPGICNRNCKSFTNHLPLGIYKKSSLNLWVKLKFLQTPKNKAFACALHSL